MPYSDDKKRLEQMMPYLRSLAEGKDVDFKITKGSANTVAFRLRESLRLARIYANDYPLLAKYAGDYSIKVESAVLVRAVRRTPLLESTAVDPATIIAPAPTPPRPTDNVEIDAVEAELTRRIGTKATPLELMRTESQRELLGRQSAISIVDLYNKFSALRPTLNFPEADLDAEELEQLWRWAESSSPKLMLMVAEPQVTVALWDPMAAEWSWRPEPKEDNDDE